jgi:hypothetical protein
MLRFVAPNIDTYVQAGVRFVGNELLLNGIVSCGDFPNGEVFLTSPGGGSAMLFDFHTTGGRNTGPFTRLLPRDHEDNLLGTFWQRVRLMPDGEIGDSAA